MDDKTSTTPRHRRTKLQVAQERLERGQRMVEEAKKTILAQQKNAEKKTRARRLFPAAGALLNIIDDAAALPAGITDADVVAALGRVLGAVRQRPDETRDAYAARLRPVMERLFGPVSTRAPADMAAARILTGHPGAAETVGALRKRREARPAP